jgi:NAD(P)-dependent dehydrogenase (short-subunit alcohol dehydrogenase family)
MSRTGTSLEGRRVLITGAARGIGAEVARVLASRGATLSLVGLEPDELARVAADLPGDGHVWFEADVVDQASLDAAVADTVAATGGIDVCVANAGIANFGTVEKGDPDAWARTVDVNLTGMFRTAHAALPHVIERKGYMLIVSSLAAFSSPPGLSAYCASKWGAEALANCMRHEVGFRGVKVGSCHPSWIDTDLTRDADVDLPSFRTMRGRLPWPAHKTTTVEECGLTISDGIQKRKRKIRVPREVAVVDWGRVLANGPLADLALRRDARKLMPQMEAEVEALGRSFSQRTERLNEQTRV